MRIYGMKSGRNNMNKLIARSIMYNSPKSKGKTVEQKEENKKLWDNEHPIASLFAWIIILVIASPLIWFIINW